MQFIRGSRPAVSVRPETDSTIQVPYLGDVGDARTAPQALSGYDRANWFAQNTLGTSTASTAKISSGGAIQVGANERGVDDKAWTDSYWTGYNVVNFPEQYTEESDSVADVWDAQTQASQGLNVVANDQVYVDQDTYSVWS